MKWDNFADDDDLAFEFTPNFNSNPGGFLVDPNAPEEGGKFGVGIGAGESPQHGLLRAAQRRRLAPLRAGDGLDRARRRTGHPLRRRPSRSPT